MRRFAALILAAIVLPLASPTEAHSQTVSGLYPQSGMVQQNTVTLDSAGGATWTFDEPFPVVPVIVHMPKAADLLQPITCNFTSISTTAVTVKCWRAAPVAVSLLGINVNALQGVITGQQVTLVARAIP